MQNLAFEQEVLRLTNEFRKEKKLKPLSLDQTLAKAADVHSENMAKQDFFSHTGKDNSKPWERAQKLGYESGYVGENIAAGYSSAKAVVDGWKNSPGHRANMLNPNYNEIGVGHYYLQNDTGKVNYNHYWTQKFGKGTVTTPTPTPSPSPTPTPKFNNSRVVNGTVQSDILIGDAANQNIYGKEGNDILKGRGGNDRLFGGGGNDRLLGGSGNDKLFGGGGKDVIQGADRNRVNEKDVLIGGGGGDRFILGDRNGSFYNDNQANAIGTTDYAYIIGFNQRAGDIIQLSSKHDYRLGASPRSVESGRALFIDNPKGQKDELIAVIQGNDGLQLNSSAFKFV